LPQAAWALGREQEDGGGMNDAGVGIEEGFFDQFIYHAVGL